MNINTMTFAARDFSARRGASDEHIPQWICKERATKSGRKRTAALRVAPNLACGCRCSSVTDPLRGMRPPRALPQAKLGATNVIVFMFMTTKDDNCENQECVHTSHSEKPPRLPWPSVSVSFAKHLSVASHFEAGFEAARPTRLLVKFHEQCRASARENSCPDRSRAGGARCDRV